MKIPNKWILLFFLAILIGGGIFAQPLDSNQLDSNKHQRILVDFGLDFGSIITIGYSYGLNLMGYQIDLGIQFKHLSGNEFGDDFAIIQSSTLWLNPAENISLGIQLDNAFRKSKNWAYEHFNVATEIGLVPMYTGDRWFAGIELLYDKSWLTYIEHSSVYAADLTDLKSGWYSMPAGNLKIGVRTGYSFPGLEIHGQGGFIWDDSFAGNNTLPFYVDLGASLDF